MTVDSTLRKYKRDFTRTDWRKLIGFGGSESTVLGKLVQRRKRKGHQYPRFESGSSKWSDEVLGGVRSTWVNKSSRMPR